ncbi:hypothetical protein BOX15_Mlig021309g2, partial [Macrostomum lignano]
PSLAGKPVSEFNLPISISMTFTVVDLKVTLLSLMATTVLAVCLGPVYALHRIRNSELASRFARGRVEERRRRRLRELWVSRMSVFAAGVFVSVGLMDLFPDAYGDLSEAADVYRWRMRRFPLSYFLMLCGFFMVLVLEQVVLSCRERQMLSQSGRSQKRRDKRMKEREPAAVNNSVETDALLGQPIRTGRANVPAALIGYGTSHMIANSSSQSISVARRARSLSDIAASWRQAGEFDEFPSIVGIRAEPVLPPPPAPWSAGAGAARRYGGVDDDNDDVIISTSQAEAAAAVAEIEAALSEEDTASSMAHECDHRSHRDHNNFVSGSQIRTVLLVAAMSVHSLFEGLSLGLIPAVGNAASLFAAILLHKLVVAFSIGMQLSSSGLSVCTVIACGCVFALMSPAGCGLGMLVIEFVNHSAAKLVSGVLQSITSGTFLYVAFFEVLPHEFNTGRDRQGKLLALVLGFAAVCIYVFIDSLKDAD